MHSVLNLKSNRPDTKADKSLKKTLIQSCFGGLFAHDDWAKLAVVTYQDDMLGSLQNWNESFWFSSLGGLIDKNLFKFQML